MRSCRSPVTVVALVCGATLLAACTGGNHTAGDAPASSVVEPTGPLDPTRQGPAPPIPGAARGGVVTLVGGALTSAAGPANGDTLDPSGNYYTTSLALTEALITRSLTQYVWDADAHAMVLVPDLATDLGTPNADYTEWTFTIRDGVRFEDGTTVTADDVAYGIKRSMDSVDFSAPPYGNDYFQGGESTAACTSRAPTTPRSRSMEPG